MLNNFKKITLATVMGVATLISGQASASVIFSDNFDSESLTLNYTGFANWDVSDGSVDLIGTPAFHDLLPGNGRYVDMDGSTSNAGKITTKSAFSLDSSASYTLSFSLAGSQRGGTDSVVVALGSLFNETFTLVSGTPFTTYIRDITPSAMTSASLSFEGLGGDNVGLLLDNVQLTRNSMISVSEPGTLALLGLGLLGFGLQQRRRQA